MNITLSHGGTYKDCYIEFHRYSNNRPALVIYHDNEVLLKASVNIPDHLVPEGYICIKDWNENEGVLKSLIENNIIEPAIHYIPVGYCDAAVCKLIKELNHGTKTYGRFS